MKFSTPPARSTSAARSAAKPLPIAPNSTRMPPWLRKSVSPSARIFANPTLSSAFAISDFVGRVLSAFGAFPEFEERRDCDVESAVGPLGPVDGPLDECPDIRTDSVTGATPAARLSAEVSLSGSQLLIRPSSSAIAESASWSCLPTCWRSRPLGAHAAISNEVPISAREARTTEPATASPSIIRSRCACSEAA